RCSKAPECKATLHLDQQGKVQQKPEPQQTGLKCDLCGGAVLKSVGRFGAYLHCVNYKPRGKQKPESGSQKTGESSQKPGAPCPFTMRLDKSGHPVRKFAPIPTGRNCEKCGSPLVVRVAARRARPKGQAKPRAPRPFLSCSNFPKCRAAMDLPPELAELGQQAVARWQETDAKNQADLAVYLKNQQP
ncbi:MAG: topoisomerase DNA-binding C4 zinc finger domain-containing protein, partial [Planctomycetota bacterium]